MSVRRAGSGDAAELSRLMRSLWPDIEDEEAEEAALRARLGAEAEPLLFVWAREGGGLGGFLEVGSRACAEGCTTSPVAYIEGWYVDADLRRAGVGRQLIGAAEAWARERGFREIASDTRIDNLVGILVHRALGYDEEERIVCFRKTLRDDSPA